MGSGGMGSGKDKKRKRKSKKHKKKSRKHDSSSSSSSSSDSEDEGERRRLKAEKAARRVGKELKGSEAVDAGYTNDSNPFGDTNLTERFVWHKKLEKQITDGVDLKELGLKAEKARQEQRLAEIERVKKRRTDREDEKAAQEEEKELMLREVALAEAVQLERKEEEFHLKQAMERSTIRLKEGRAKPIDILYQNLNASLAEFDMSMTDPTVVFAGLSLKELQALRDDITSHASLADNDTHRQFWRSLLVLADAELKDAKASLDRERARARGAPEQFAAGGLHVSVDDDVKSMMVDKSYTELLELEESIQETLRSGDGEVEYWEAVLQLLAVSKARARISEISTDLVAKARALQHDREGAAQQRQVAEAMGWDKEDDEATGTRVPAAAAAADDDGAGPSDASQWEPPSPPRAPAAVEALVAFSPRLITMVDVPRGEVVEDAEEDKRTLRSMRTRVATRDGREFGRAAAKASASTPAVSGDLAYRKMVTNTEEKRPDFGLTKHITVGGDDDDASRASAQKMMGAADQGEVEFKGEVNMEKQAYWWHDKYRPRKPKYFNRVHTGYEWNKYNQTHYDHDNPPPKVVQGYKFNIFYPDLIDKTKAPTYKVIPDGSNHGETAVLVFQAGPPYEDIAFKIVNKDWEFSHKRGFKCSFERGIMHLYINFKRFRYRR